MRGRATNAPGGMSASGQKQTFHSRLTMSAFGGKADIDYPRGGAGGALLADNWQLLVLI